MSILTKLLTNVTENNFQADYITKADGYLQFFTRIIYKTITSNRRLKLAGNADHMYYLYSGNHMHDCYSIKKKNSKYGNQTMKIH